MRAKAGENEEKGGREEERRRKKERKGERRRETGEEKEERERGRGGGAHLNESVYPVIGIYAVLKIALYIAPNWIMAFLFNIFSFPVNKILNSEHNLCL